MTLMKHKMKIVSNSKKKTIKEGFTEFILTREAYNLSGKTIINYKDNYRYFTEYINENMSCFNIDKNTVTGYINHLRQKKQINDVSLETYIRHLRAILYYFMECEYTPYFKVILPKADESLKEPYTDEELDKLLAKPKIKNDKDFAEYRNWVMVCLFLGDGTRSRTVRNIKRKDVDLLIDRIVLRAMKDRKTDGLPLGKALSKILTEYLSKVPGEPDDYLFPSVQGRQLTEGGLISAIKRYNKKRGVTRTSPHLFRHTFAREWILSEGNPIVLQRILGHKTMEMVNRYVRLYSRDMKKNISTHNVLDRKFKDFSHKMTVVSNQ